MDGRPAILLSCYLLPSSPRSLGRLRFSGLPVWPVVVGLCFGAGVLSGHAAAVAPPPASAPATAATPAAGSGQDVLFRRGGGLLVGRVVAADPACVQIEVPLAADQPPARVSLARRAVERVDFAGTAGVRGSLATVGPERLAGLAQAWQARQSWLDLPDSPAAEIGLAYAELLLRSADPAQRQRALAVFGAIEAGAWDDAARGRARTGRLRALVATGRAAEAVDEAAAVAASTDDPEVLIEAKLVLGENAARALAALVAEHPRWQLEDGVRPERDRLFDEALDLFLFPYLFHGTAAGPAARGLRRAAELQLAGGDRRQAAELAADLLALYPAAPEADFARQLLAAAPPRGERRHNRQPRGNPMNRHRPPGAVTPLATVGETVGPPGRRRPAALPAAPAALVALVAALLLGGPLVVESLGQAPAAPPTVAGVPAPPGTAAAPRQDVTQKSLFDIYRTGGMLMHPILLC